LDRIWLISVLIKGLLDRIPADLPYPDVFISPSKGDQGSPHPFAIQAAFAGKAMTETRLEWDSRAISPSVSADQCGGAVHKSPRRGVVRGSLDSIPRLHRRIRSRSNRFA
jgi:hypothetical protein